MNIICKNCNKEFIVPNTKAGMKRQYCGPCAKSSNGKNNKGRKHSEETKQLLSRLNSGSNNAFYGKRHSIESKNKMSESNQWTEDKFRYCNLSDLELEVLDGILLADGHMEKSRISGRLTYGCKYQETLLDIQKDLPSLSFSNIWQSTKTRCYHFKSLYYRDLLFIRNLWYDNLKGVPIDVKITPKSCYWWYIGDGYTSRYGLSLCTDSFTLNDISILRDKLYYHGFDTTHTKSNNRIRVRSKSKQSFLDWIGQYGIAKQYAYKWNS
ncbi:hypothetical protein KAR91_24040 [Candidatus Pacearchaeota archaeon]|nr:hypothetical protein [Candidatus Pacearchaeota archaeon]